MQNRDGPRSIDEPLVQDNGSESDVSTWDKKDSNDSNPDKDGSENQTDATQHEVIVKETESETDNKLTTSNKIVIDPAVECDLRRREAIVTRNEFYKENPQYKNDSSVIDAEDTDESSGASVAPETDGWEPEANRKRRKRNTKVIPTNSGQLAVQTVSLKKRVPRVRRHVCHLCGDDFEMQSNFTKHMKEKHPNDLFQCEYCDKTMESSNGLFKHQRSHLYLKHVCEVCERWFQFPGQKSRHMKIHTQKDLFPCLHCPKKYTTNSGMLEHAKTHTTSLQCELCPKSTKKRYNNKYSLAQHTKGMHGGGWTAPCKANFKWKSRYSRHLSTCEKCKQIRKQQKKERYHFIESSVEDSENDA